jgi:CheY-like chemotaxis protein
VVEDEFAVRLGLQYLLEDEGYGVELARDSGEAKDLLAQTSYDLAIVDLRMPIENGTLDEDAGIDLLQWIERNHTALPVIVLTVRDDPEAIQACRSIKNVKEYVVKDPNPSTLRRVVGGFLGTRSTIAS